MFVVAIIATLFAIAIPNFFRVRNMAKDSRAISDIKLIEKEILIYQLATGKLPDSLSQIGLHTLRDPWGNPYQYLNIETVKGKGKLRKDHSMVPVNTDFDLYSMGADGESRGPFTAKASRDDIVRANNGQYVGSVSKY